MAIKSIQVGQAGVSNRTPSWVYIETNDTIATVTTAGYLTGASKEYVNSFQPNMMALVATKTSPGIGVQPVLYLLQLSYSNGVWSLVSPAVDVPVPFIVLGDIQAGASGTAGKFISYPSTAAKGSLNFQAVANTGNTVTTVSNAAMGQASVVSIPDPGVASTNFVLTDSASTQTIATGNFTIAGGNLNVIGSGKAIFAGASGTAGQITIFPATASKGTLEFVASNNTGNTLTSVTNASMGQASAFTIPDPGTATANFAVAPSALVSGNLVKASGTAGLLVDGGAAVHAGTTGTYAGGSTSNAFTVTGMASTWIVIASNLTATNSVSITKVVPSTNTLTITWSGDPGASTTVSWVAFTAAI